MTQIEHNESKERPRSQPVRTSSGASNLVSSPPETIQLTLEQFRSLLKAMAQQAGCASELARRLDVSGQWISDILRGKKRPGKKLIHKLGGTLEMVVNIPISRGEEDSQ